MYNHSERLHVEILGAVVHRDGDIHLSVWVGSNKSIIKSNECIDARAIPGDSWVCIQM